MNILSVTCKSKTKNNRNMVKTYILEDSDGTEYKVDRKTLVQMLRDIEKYEFTNLQLTHNNRITHKGALDTKAKYINE